MDTSTLLNPRQRRKKKYINKPFNRLPLKRRAVFILYLAGFTYKQIEKLGIASPKTINRAISMAYQENYT